MRDPVQISGSPKALDSPTTAKEGSHYERNAVSEKTAMGGTASWWDDRGHQGAMNLASHMGVTSSLRQVNLRSAPSSKCRWVMPAEGTELSERLSQASRANIGLHQTTANSSHGSVGAPGPGGACLRRQLADSAEDVAVSAIFDSSALYFLERKHLGQRQKNHRIFNLLNIRHHRHC